MDMAKKWRKIIAKCWSLTKKSCKLGYNDSYDKVKK
jgi:hypothetical protein